MSSPAVLSLPSFGARERDNCFTRYSIFKDYLGLSGGRQGNIWMVIWRLFCWCQTNGVVAHHVTECKGYLSCEIG